MDVREVRRWFPPAAHARAGTDPLRLCFLLGDQIYMDLKKKIDIEKPNSWSEPLAKAPDPWTAYLNQWGDRKYAGLFFEMPPCLFLADDHEVWNDYPHTPPWLGWTKGESGRKFERQARNAFDVFQGALNLDPERIAGAAQISHSLIRQHGHTVRFDVPPLSFFLLDTRLGRTRLDTPGALQFTDPAHLDALVQWLAEPGGLGILAVAPPVFQGKGSAFDHNLADYTADYTRLISALASARKRVLILAGDIHYTRLYSITRFDPVDARDELRLVELTSSPLSRLKDPPGMSGPSGPEVRSGVLGDSGAHFVLESTDATLGNVDFVSTSRQTYCTVSFTHVPAQNAIRVVISAWDPPSVTGPAHLALQRTLSFGVEEP
jgi:phosphodiesterase/alkaline phosphatase D-like protein